MHVHHTNRQLHPQPFQFEWFLCAEHIEFYFQSQQQRCIQMSPISLWAKLRSHSCFSHSLHTHNYLILNYIQMKPIQWSRSADTEFILLFDYSIHFEKKISVSLHSFCIIGPKWMFIYLWYKFDMCNIQWHFPRRNRIRMIIYLYQTRVNQIKYIPWIESQREWTGERGRFWTEVHRDIFAEGNKSVI